MTSLPLLQKRTDESVRAGIFAVSGAKLLRQLESGTAGAELRMGLSLLEKTLHGEGLHLEVLNGTVRVSGVAIPAGTAAAWRAPLEAAGVAEVMFETGTTARELLLFLSLLAAPGDASAFATTWWGNGSWRIQIAQKDEVKPAEPKALYDNIGSLRTLCDAVARGEARSSSSAVLTELRARGAAGTEALLDALTRAHSGSQRHLLFNAIVTIGEGAEHLIAALKHDDWRVVRHAAALLGELKVEDAVLPLATVSHHGEYRVRLAAVTSLGQLGAREAHQALHAAVNDPHPEVRTRAWWALAHSPVAPTVALLDAALRSPEVPEVQHAILSCAAAFPALDVTAGLVRFCAREFSQRSHRELLVFGVEQLAARSPASAKPFISRLPERLAQSA